MCHPSSAAARPADANASVSRSGPGAPPLARLIRIPRTPRACHSRVNVTAIGPERKSLAASAYALLKDQIIDNRLPPGSQKLEEELALQLGMSRTPVREAIIRLEREGFVEVVPRRGVRVRALTKRDVREITEVLTCLESQAAERLAGRRLAPQEMARL